MAITMPEPRIIEGYKRTYHPLYYRWQRMMRDPYWDCDLIFKSFYGFTQWFNSQFHNQPVDYTLVLKRRNQTLPWTIENTYLSTNRQTNRQPLFDSFTEQQKQQLNQLISQNATISRISHVFKINRKTAKRLKQMAINANEEP